MPCTIESGSSGSSFQQGKELRYFRDTERREVDFVLLENKQPLQFIECKLRGREVSPALRYLKKKFPQTEAMQISLYRDDDFVNKDGIRVCPAEKYLLGLI